MFNHGLFLSVKDCNNQLYLSSWWFYILFLVHIIFGFSELFWHQAFLGDLSTFPHTIFSIPLEFSLHCKFFNSLDFYYSESKLKRIANSILNFVHYFSAPVSLHMLFYFLTVCNRVIFSSLKNLLHFVKPFSVSFTI